MGSYAPWLAILRRLLPALRDPTYLVQWWDQMTEPVLDHMAQDKNLAKEAWANTLAVLTYDNGVEAADGQGANQIAIKLMKTWMQSFQLSNSDGNSSGSLKATLIRSGLLSYGKKRPKVRSCQFYLPRTCSDPLSGDWHTALLRTTPIALYYLAYQCKLKLVAEPRARSANYIHRLSAGVLVLWK